MTERREIDTALYAAVPHGAYTQLADFRGIKRQNISKYYDPKDGEYQSVFSKALVELQVIGRVCPAWARNILGVFNRFGVEWCGAPTPSQSGGVLQDIISTAARLLDPNTPETERMGLAMKLHADAGVVVDGLRFQDREDAAGDEPMNRPVVSSGTRI